MVDVERRASAGNRRASQFAWASLALASLAAIVLVVEGSAGLVWPHREIEFYQALLAVLLVCGAGLRVAAFAAGAFALVRLSQAPRETHQVVVAVCGVVAATMAERPARVALCLGLAVAFPYLPGLVRALAVACKRVTAFCDMDKPRVSRMAIASLVLGGLALVLLVVGYAFEALFLADTYGYLEFGMWLMLGAMPLSPLAVVLGSVAIVQIREQPQRLRGMALAVGGTAAGVVTLTGGLGTVMFGFLAVGLLPVAGVVALVLWLRRRRDRARAAATAPAQAEENAGAVCQAEEDAEAPTTAASRPPTSSLAVAALVLGALTLPTIGLAGLAGIIVGVAALVSIRLGRGRVQGMGLALGGITLSVACLGLVAIFLVFPIYKKSKASAQKAVCLSNVKSLARAVQMYLADNDDVFPDAGNWCEALRPYAKNDEVFICPTAPGLRCAYAYNAALSGVRLDALADPVRTIAIFESEAGWNAHGGPELLSEEPRHLGGDDLGFADGHAAWMHRERLLSEESTARWEVE